MTTAELPNRENLYPAEVAKFLRINIRTVYDMISEGIIPAVRIRRNLRIPRQEFLDWYRNQRVEQNSLCA